ncbi:hypothetical protein [Paracoccus sp. S1E-3]|uniref:COG4315 family predicted lipoprotein n=1 Tax=Paracoccus sp. S1E-3 TaxID=2756130 RepID=UPI0015EEA775|nr:hypothetical protein [Paracoccus sp. S1E-3]MBA4489683.1 hypothetical protein [Paracoccus sp. S1E-3]
MRRFETGLGLLAVTSALMLALPASAAGVLAAQNGMTLYTFDNDSEGMSSCYDDCAKNWPPYLAAEGEVMPDGWTRVTRTDGTEQWALDGKPLYFYYEDMASGDVKGDGKGDVWHVVTMSD